MSDNIHGLQWNGGIIIDDPFDIPVEHCEPPTYSKEDVLQLCNAVLDNWRYENHQGTAECRYCGSFSETTPFGSVNLDEHKKDCPVLAACKIIDHEYHYIVEDLEKRSS